MYKFSASFLGVCSSVLGFQASAAEQGGPQPDFGDTIVVTSAKVTELNQDSAVVTATTSGPDAASLVARVPGAAIIGNGPISGQVQHRGLFSDRLSIRIAGQDFLSSGPNLMDPPLHYVPMPLLSRIIVSRDVASVSDGPSLGASVDAELLEVSFSKDSAPNFQSKGSVSFNSATDGYALGTVTGVASDRWKLEGLLSYEKGGDTRAAKTRLVRASGYDRLAYGLGGGVQTEKLGLNFAWRKQETGPSGNPPFAMDIAFFNGDFFNASGRYELAGAVVEASLSHASISHAMDNYSLRPAPTDASRIRRSEANADTWAGKLALEIVGMKAGLDWQRATRDVTIRNPNMAEFWIASLNGVEQSRVGAFAEVVKSIQGLHVEAGLRVDRHTSHIGDALVGAATPPLLSGYAATTTSRNRDRSKTTVDGIVRIWREVGALQPYLTLAHKQRFPNAVELHSWMPTEASGGLADGNIYIGNKDLKPEGAWVASAGVDFTGRNIILKPSVFYRRIDDFIQGVPVPASYDAALRIAAMNGDATPLMFANTDAEMVGGDISAQWFLSSRLQADAVVSYVRGSRRDIDDHLYRMAPLNGRIGVSWTQDHYQLGAEVLMAAAQKRVSASNGETTSPGWATVNLWGRVQINGGLSLDLGIENIFDKSWADHLSGINRVRDSDIGVGERVPGKGRHGFARLSWSY